MEPAEVDALRGLTAVEDAAQQTARAQAEPVTSPPPPEVGSLLAWLAATAAARHVVEIGTAGGVTGLWLLKGMSDRGVLTSIESDNAIHGAATAAFEHARLADRVRSILGDPDEVLSRLSDDGYDLCIVQADRSRMPGLLQHARRLLKTGGLLVVLGAHGPALRAFADLVSENEDVAGTALPFAGGVGVATIG